MPRLTAHEAVARVLGCNHAAAIIFVADLALYGYFIWPEALIEAVRVDAAMQQLEDRAAE